MTNEMHKQVVAMAGDVIVEAFTRHVDGRGRAVVSWRCSSCDVLHVEDTEMRHGVVRCCTCRAEGTLGARVGTTTVIEANGPPVARPELRVGTVIS